MRTVLNNKKFLFESLKRRAADVRPPWLSRHKARRAFALAARPLAGRISDQELRLRVALVRRAKPRRKAEWPPAAKLAQPA